MSKERKIEIITDLLKISDWDYVNNVFKLLIQEDLTTIKDVLGGDDYEALKNMILEEEKED